MQAPEYVLAFDLGGTGFRAAIVDRTGRLVSQDAIALNITADIDGCAEVSPAKWWTTLVHLADRLQAAQPMAFAGIGAIAICGITRTQVFLDSDHRSLRPAMCFGDTRAAEVALHLADRLPTDAPLRGHLNAFHPLARLGWLQQHEATVFAAIDKVVEPKDWLNLQLTGQLGSDPISMAPLRDALDRSEVRNDLPGLSDRVRRLLPPLLPPTTMIGRIRDGLPYPLSGLVGRPVFTASHDTWCAVLGIGALRDGIAYNLSGTTEVFGAIAERSTFDTRNRPMPEDRLGLLSVDWGDGLQQLGGPGQSGADCAAWLLEAMDDARIGEIASGRVPDTGTAPADGGARLAALLARERDPQPALFIPHLAGARVPYWDPNMRAAFLGLNRRHGTVDLAWAVIEGIACLNRVTLERVETLLGRQIREIRIGGGAARSPVWCQARADICNRRIVAGSEEPGLLGAAALAWTGLGLHASLQLAQAALGDASTARVFVPTPSRRAFHDALFDMHVQAQACLTPVSRALAALRVG